MEAPASSHRLDRAPCELDRSLATEQLQQDEHPLVGAQSAEQTNLIVQRALQHLHPHTGREPAQSRQLDKTIPFARADLGDHGIRDARRYLTIHDQTAHAGGPARIPPAADHPHKQIAREKWWRDYDPAAVAAASAQVMPMASALL
jgi:hypothetical protein